MFFGTFFSSSPYSYAYSYDLLGHMEPQMGHFDSASRFKGASQVCSLDRRLTGLREKKSLSSTSIVAEGARIL